MRGFFKSFEYFSHRELYRGKQVHRTEPVIRLKENMISEGNCKGTREMGKKIKMGEKVTEVMGKESSSAKEKTSKIKAKNEQ